MNFWDQLGSEKGRITSKWFSPSRREQINKCSWWKNNHGTSAKAVGIWSNCCQLLGLDPSTSNVFISWNILGSFPNLRKACSKPSMAPRRPWRARRAWKPFSSHVRRSLGHFSQKIIPQVMVHQTRIISPSFTIQKTGKKKHSPLELPFAQKKAAGWKSPVTSYKCWRSMMQVGQPVMGKMSSYVQINHKNTNSWPFARWKSVKSSSHFPVPEVKPCYPRNCLQQPLEELWISQALGGLNERTVASFCMRRTTLIDKYVYKCISIWIY